MLEQVIGSYFLNFAIGIITIKFLTGFLNLELVWVLSLSQPVSVFAVPLPKLHMKNKLLSIVNRLSH